MIKKELLEGFTEEQIAKANACNSSEELLELAREEGVELTPEQLEAVTGGCGTKNDDDDGKKDNRGPNVNPF